MNILNLSKLEYYRIMRSPNLRIVTLTVSLEIGVPVTVIPKVSGVLSSSLVSVGKEFSSKPFRAKFMCFKVVFFHTNQSSPTCSMFSTSGTASSFLPFAYIYIYYQQYFFILFDDCISVFHQF